MVDKENEELREEKAAKNGNETGFATVNLLDLIQACKKRWWWFVVSLVICLTYGMLHFLRTVPTYERSTLVLVANDGNSTGDDAGAMFQTLGLGEVNPGKLNEMISLTSPSQMIDLTRALHLNETYKMPGRWHDTDLYRSTLPVSVSFPCDSTSEQNASLQTEILPGGKIKVLSASFDGKNAPNLNAVVDYSRNQTLKTPVGDFTFSANPEYVGTPITEPMPLNIHRAGIYETAMSLTGRIKSEILEEKSDIIKMSIVDPIPQRAEDILHNVVLLYNANWARERQEVAQNTSAFISERIDGLVNELGSVDDRIAGIKSSHLMMDPESAAASYMTQAANANTQATAISNQLAMSRYVRDFLAAASSSNTILPSNTGLNNANIETQIAEYNRTLFERNSLENNSSANNPIVIELDTRLDALRRALLQSLDNQITALNTQLASAQRTENISTGKIAASPVQARMLLDAERAQKVKESLYLFLLQRREESNLAEQLRASKVKAISRPTGSPSSLGPYRNSVLMISFLIGILLPLGLIFLIETMNTRVRHRKDLEALKVPFAGELPIVGKDRFPRLKKLLGRKEEQKGVLVEPDNLDFINEAFRVLRTNIELMARHDETSDATVMAITSLYPGSGKTFISMNLATALAIKGRRVLMMDMDLRRYSLSESLVPHRHENGLVDYLVGVPGNDIESITVRNVNSIPGLDLIPCGIIPPNPSELLTDPKLASLFAELKRRYDYIVLDCPPAEMVADTLIINPFVDMTLFVIRAGLYRRSQLPLVQELYDGKRYNSLSVILNCAPENTDGYGYGYRYGNYRRRYAKALPKKEAQKA